MDDEIQPLTDRTYWLTRSMMLRGLGVVYLIAFVSFWIQIDGLIGSRGILPVGQLMNNARNHFSTSSLFAAVWNFPTLLWLSDADWFLHLLCAVGCAASLVLIGGFAPIAMTIILWICYLSLVVTGGVFMSYQWDALLLEAGLLAIVFCPWSLTLRFRADAPPSIIVIWLYRWLTFRLMFSSGVVKLASGDDTWWGLTAMQYHYWTQPIPNPPAWYVHQLPAWFGKVSTFGMFVCELGVPLLIFGPVIGAIINYEQWRPRVPRGLRWFSEAFLGPRAAHAIAFIMLVGLQVGILFTGNYTYFNLLAIVLCMSLLDDGQWLWLSRRFAARIPDLIGPPRTWRTRIHRWVIVVPLCLAIVMVTAVQMDDVRARMGQEMQRRFGKSWAWAGEPFPWPGFWQSGYKAVRPFRSINSYGLFADMTETRPELEILGSDDGLTWKEYVFRYKPGDTARRPPQVAPHQPRVDWQMWFAALHVERTGQLPPWMGPFLTRLLEGSPPVLALLDENPFPAHPPRYVRVLMYQYRFTTAQQRRQSGQWWHRQYVREVLGPASLSPRDPP